MTITSKTLVGNETYSNDNFTKFMSSKNQQGSVVPPQPDAASVEKKSKKK